MKEIDFLFIVEHKDRELDSIKIISSILKNKYKKKVVIISLYYHLFLIYKYCPKVIVMPAILGCDVWVMKDIYNVYGNSVVYVNLNWEQLLAPINFIAKQPKDDFAKKMVIHFVWNDVFRKFLIEKGVNENNIRVTDNLTRELLIKYANQNSKEIRCRLAKKFLLDVSKKWIFFPLNYGWAFQTKEMIDGRIASGHDQILAWEYHYYSKLCLEKFINFIGKISSKTDFEIIIRPHPSISPIQYQEVFQKILLGVPSSVKILKDYTIKEWISASDFIASSWSTSVYESFLIGKPSFFYTPIPRPKWLNTNWMDEVQNIANYEQFNFFIENIIPSVNLKSDLNAHNQTALYLNELSIKKNSCGQIKPNLARSQYLYDYYLKTRYFIRDRKQSGFEFDYFAPIGKSYFSLNDWIFILIRKNKLSRFLLNLTKK